MESLYTSGWEDYQLLDTGDQLRLEQVGSLRVCRPEPNALWRQSLPQSEWSKADLRYQGSKSEPWRTVDPAFLQGRLIKWNGLHFLIKPTPFRHLGIFPEQVEQWRWLEQKLAGKNRPLKVLNLFAYTGAATIVAAKAGAEVVHVDASKSSVYWASDNAKASGLSQAKIHWVVEDVRKFVARERKRGHTYDLILADPPVFGRGPNGDIWRLEEDLSPLLADLAGIYSGTPLGFSLNIYATSIYPRLALRLVQDRLGALFPSIELLEVGLLEKNGNQKLQTGYWLRS